MVKWCVMCDSFLVILGASSISSKNFAFLNDFLNVSSFVVWVPSNALWLIFFLIRIFGRVLVSFGIGFSTLVSDLF